MQHCQRFLSSAAKDTCGFGVSSLVATLPGRGGRRASLAAARLRAEGKIKGGDPMCDMGDCDSRNVVC